MSSKEFMEIIDQMQEIHHKKSADYSSSANTFSNFEITASIVKYFNNPIDQVFVGLIGTKLARLSELLNSNKTPNNESIVDSFIDLANYSALWGAYYKRIDNATAKILVNQNQGL